ncbi:2067_t:CDS:2 [Diversispora eburnea]|uniref:Uridylate kinase n=1 Tax=Diversispora eburnea TaxID=1213867 RepID=A0A9N9F833_9GLOM|nr:2067_t:CDS:2 [Diversispora eburnea]
MNFKNSKNYLAVTGKPKKHKHLVKNKWLEKYEKTNRKKSRPPLVNPYAIIAVFSVLFSAYYILIPKEKDKHKMNISRAKVSKDEVTVVFVLGGPGCGKGTQCAKLVQDFGFVHLSEEQQRKGSEFGELIRNYIKEGKIVPMEITIALLEKAMIENDSNRFLIDGFPRALDQAQQFEKEVVESTTILFFDCPEDVMLQRLLKRGETSGRIDDNVESIKKRFETFKSTSYPVIEHYRKVNKVHTIPCADGVDEVYSKVKPIVEGLFKQ